MFSTFTSSTASALRLSQSQKSPILLQFPQPDVVITTDATPNHWAFYFQGSWLMYPVVEPGQVLCTMFISPYKNSSQLH